MSNTAIRTIISSNHALIESHINSKADYYTQWYKDLADGKNQFEINQYELLTDKTVPVETAVIGFEYTVNSPLAYIGYSASEPFKSIKTINLFGQSNPNDTDVQGLISELKADQDIYLFVVAGNTLVAHRIGKLNADGKTFTPTSFN